MESPADIIRSYLVSLGFEVNQTQKKALMDALNEISKLIEEKSTSWMKTYAKGGAAVFAALTSVVTATTTLLDKTAQADMTYQKFALRMFMSADAAKKLKIVTDAMGESMEDIAWQPEIFARYLTLMNEARRMELPVDATSQFRQIRNIRQEFTQLKMETTYGMQWVGYHLIKYFNQPLRSGHNWLRRLNEWIVNNMPMWTEKVARFFQIGIQLASRFFDVIKGIIEQLGKLWNALTDNQKMGVVGGGLLALFAVGGPFTRALMILTALTFAWDEFMTALEGGETTGAAKWLMEICELVIKTALWFEKLAIHWTLLSFAGPSFGNKEREARKKGLEAQLEDVNKRIDEENRNPTMNKIGVANKALWAAVDERNDRVTALGGTILNKAIRRREVGGVDAKGGNAYDTYGPVIQRGPHKGERAYGIHQWLMSTWEGEKKLFGLPDDFDIKVPANQDKMAKLRSEYLYKKYKGDVVSAASEQISGPKGDWTNPEVRGYASDVMRYFLEIAKSVNATEKDYNMGRKNPDTKHKLEINLNMNGKAIGDTNIGLDQDQTTRLMIDASGHVP